MVLNILMSIIIFVIGALSGIAIMSFMQVCSQADDIIENNMEEVETNDTDK